jgi:hypothetical protein
MRASATWRARRRSRSGGAGGAVRGSLDAQFERMGRLTSGQGGFWLCLVDAQQQQQRYDPALETARKLLHRCKASKMSTRQLGCVAWALTAIASIHLDTGRTADARTAMVERLEVSRDG